MIKIKNNLIKKVINISKIELDKYYTSKKLAKYIIDKTKEIIGEDNIAEYLEPSAGNGVFLDYLPPNTLAYDIEPEDNRIIKQDFLTLDLLYKKSRCIIGNPPYGSKLKLAEQFFKKSILLGDYIAFILPISQLHNNNKLFDFDFIFSEDLGKQLYSNRQIHCCFNIYRRPKNGLNKKPNYKLKDIQMKTSYRKEFPPKAIFITRDMFNYDFRICNWGASIGKFCEYEGQYSTEICIKINNEIYKDKIIELLKSVKWTEIYPMVATPKIDQWHIQKYIKEQIPEIK